MIIAQNVRKSLLEPRINDKFFLMLIASLNVFLNVVSISTMTRRRRGQIQTIIDSNLKLVISDQVNKDISLEVTIHGNLTWGPQIST